MIKSGKSKAFAAALATLTLATTLTAASGEAQARHRHGAAFGVGLIAGTLIGAAIVSSSQSYATGYRECRYVERYDRWGNLRVYKVCDYVPY